MVENPDFEQDYWSRTATGTCKRAHDNIRIMNWLTYYDRSHFENINYYDLLGSVSKFLTEISNW